MFSKKFNNIEFITNREVFLDLFPPEPAKKVVPDWYKELDLDTYTGRQSQYGDTWPTVKKCIPVQDFITSGYIIRNSCEMEIKKVKEYDDTMENEVVPADQSMIGKHPHNQCPVTIQGENRHYFKFNQPWMIKTPPGYSCLILQPFYFFEQRFTILPAIVDTDNHDMEINFPAMNNMPENHKYTIEVGIPLVQVIPFKRENWSHTKSVGPTWVKSKLELFLRDGYKKIHHVKKFFK